MSEDSASKEPASDALAKSKQLAKGLSEQDYLARQAADAQAAIKQTLADMASSLAAAADPRDWTREYPWPAVGASALGGFLLAFALVPRKDEAHGRDGVDGRRNGKWHSDRDERTFGVREDGRAAVRTEKEEAAGKQLAEKAPPLDAGPSALKTWLMTALTALAGQAAAMVQRAFTPSPADQNGQPVK